MARAASEPPSGQEHDPLPATLEPNAPPPLAPGTELAPGYQVIAHLNRGNRLDVYDAWSSERASRCVLKTLRPDRASEGPARRALQQEGRLLLRFTHPHLVRAYELTRALDDGRPVLVLETLGGETLSHLVHRLDEAGRRLSPGEVAELGLQLGSVLTYLHHHGWLHLDLKPANIVAEAGRARLIDLSIARRPGRAPAGTGTYEYLSPEQARGDRLTTAADVWGLGAVLFATLAGEPPYGYPDEDDGVTTLAHSDADAHDASADSDADSELSDTSGTEPLGLVYPQLAGDPPGIRRRRPRTPAALADLVDACLRREPGARPTLPEVRAALESFLASRLDQRRPEGPGDGS